MLVDLVDVEAGIRLQGDVVDCVEDVAVADGAVVDVLHRLHARCGEGEVFLTVCGVAAGFVEGFELCHEAAVEGEEVVIGLHEGDCCGDFLRIVGPDAGVVDQGAGKVVVGSVVGVEHG